MSTHNLAVAAMIAVSAALSSASGYSACDTLSGPKTAALVELYTSEGCSSCSPADLQLSRLGETLDPSAAVVPLALHVDYWDYIGWKDPFAQSTFGERQSWLAGVNRLKTVYTPQFFVAGEDLRALRSGLRDQVRRLNALPAGADIRVHGRLTATGDLALAAEATAPTGRSPTALYLAVAESGLTSKVSRGENIGTTLTHDHVVRVWIGPIHLADGAARIRREVSLPAEWRRMRIDVIAFVQELRSGHVLQALISQHCADS